MGMGCWPATIPATARELVAEVQKIFGAQAVPQKGLPSPKSNRLGKVVSGAGTPFMRGSDGALGMLPRRSLRA
jgi:hypothetical protein